MIEKCIEKYAADAGSFLEAKSQNDLVRHWTYSIEYQVSVILASKTINELLKSIAKFKGKEFLKAFTITIKI